MTNTTQTAPAQIAETEPPMTTLRKMFPRMRRTAATAIVHSGGIKRVYGCLCGAGISMDSRWRVPKRVWEWRARHSACAATMLEVIRQSPGAWSFRGGAQGALVMG